MLQNEHRTASWFSSIYNLCCHRDGIRCGVPSVTAVDLASLVEHDSGRLKSIFMFDAWLILILGITPLYKDITGIRPFYSLNIKLHARKLVPLCLLGVCICL